MSPGSNSNPQVTTVSLKPLSELIVADRFIERYRNCFNRIDDEDNGDEHLFVVPHLADKENRTILPGGAVPDTFMLGKIVQFIQELTANEDDFTKIRLGKFSFARGVLNYLKIDPRVRYPMPTHGRDDAYDPRRLDEVFEGRRARRDEMRARRDKAYA
jgi:hypothetical protein